MYHCVPVPIIETKTNKVEEMSIRQFLKALQQHGDSTNDNILCGAICKALDSAPN